MRHAIQRHIQDDGRREVSERLAFRATFHSTVVTIQRVVTRQDGNFRFVVVEEIGAVVSGASKALVL
ncbi:hypothetical protein [Hymenobacter seoulensis]